MKYAKVRGFIHSALAAVAVGAVFAVGGLAQAASDPGGDRPDPGDARSRPVPPRPGLRSAYPYVPPAPPPPPAPPTPDVPSICLQRATIICASKAEKTLRYFEGGGVWLSTPVAFGRPGYETPGGLYAVQVKDANAWSYEFNAPMPYSLEYDLGRGIYIHYSSTYAAVGPTYIGSHGCINIGNLATAKTLFNRVAVGTPVYVY